MPDDCVSTLMPMSFKAVAQVFQMYSIPLEPLSCSASTVTTNEQVENWCAHLQARHTLTGLEADLAPLASDSLK